MSYLLFQMALYMLATLILGFLLGWYIWGNLFEEGNVLGKLGFGAGAAGTDDGAVRPAAASTADADTVTALRQENSKMKADIDRITAQRNRAQDDLDACVAKRKDIEGELAALRAQPAPKPMVAKVVSTAPAAQSKPKGLSGPRNNRADDLKEIKGIGPALEKMLHGMGVYHFDQIASWGSSELAWVDDNLEGFKGRASRDSWISQAKKIVS